MPPLITAGISAQAIELAQRGRLILPVAAPDQEIEATHPLPWARASAVAALLAERDEGY